MIKLSINSEIQTVFTKNILSMYLTQPPPQVSEQPAKKMTDSRLVEPVFPTRLKDPKICNGENAQS